MPYPARSSATPPRPRRWRIIVCGLMLAGLLPVASVRAARDDDLITQLQDEIRTLETMTADSANSADRPRLERRLQTLRQELVVMQKRQSIEAQEHNLQTAVRAQPQELLRARLQPVPADTAGAEASLRELAARSTQATLERDGLRRQLEAPGKGIDAAATAQQAELEEKIFTRNEELRALTLKQDAVETEIDLARRAQVLRERLRAAEAPPHLSLRALFDQRLLVHGSSAAGGQLAARLANLDENRRNSEEAFNLARQRIEKFDEELQLLERQTGFLRRNARAEHFIAVERAQKRLLGERLPFLADQVEALRKTRELVQTQQELTALETRWLEDQYRRARTAYLERLQWPVLVAAVLVGLYLLISRTVLPRRYRKEELFLARRLGRYATVVLVVMVVAAYLIEDLALLATTLGIVSAALVISLQDVCTSLCGWFVIMLGRKFTIGDRLEIDGTLGDVLDIQILRTTLLEVNNWLGVDHPTGRVLVVPNNFIFKNKVFNSTYGHPYIWNKIDLTVTFNTPAASAMALFERVLEEETRNEFAEAREAGPKMERRFGVADAEYRPKIYMRIDDNGVKFTLLYVCHYRMVSSLRNRISRRIVAELETRPQIQLAFNTLTVLASKPKGGPTAVLGSENI